MNRIDMAPPEAKFGAAWARKTPVRCDDCGWKGVRVLKIITGCVGHPFDPDPERVAEDDRQQRQQTRTALNIAREMKSSLPCPKCNSEDVYWRPDF